MAVIFRRSSLASQLLQVNVTPVGAAEGCDLLLLLKACHLKLLAALVQLAHQLRLSLGQTAGLGQFVDAGAHPDQFRRLFKSQSVRQGRDDRPQLMQVFAHLIGPTLCVGMQPVTLRVTSRKRNAERP